MTIYPVTALRTLALFTQNLHASNSTDHQPTPEAIYHLVEQIGCIQIDTLTMVRRSQYIVPWSRLGAYDPAMLDALAVTPNRRLFEGMQHAACIIPLEEYRYQLPRQRRVREEPSKNTRQWLSDPNNNTLIESVRKRIRREGALRTSDFEGDGHKRNSWWDWKPAKHALELLYARGDLMIDKRDKFQRYYDLTERVLPKWVDTAEPSSIERDRFWVERGARALGACLPRHAGDYTWMGVSKSRPIVERLIKDGILLPIRGRRADGTLADLVIHRDNLSYLEQASDRSLKAQRTTFLSPFDSLLWASHRDEMLWGFHQSLECYLPAPRRVYGYFCLPILHHDRLVGRFDPKLERKNGLLRLTAIYLEPSVKQEEELVSDTTNALHDFMLFHQAQDLVIEHSQPPSFGKKLMKAL